MREKGKKNSEQEARREARRLAQKQAREIVEEIAAKKTSPQQDDDNRSGGADADASGRNSARTDTENQHTTTSETASQQQHSDTSRNTSNINKTPDNTRVPGTIPINNTASGQSSWLSPKKQSANHPISRNGDQRNRRQHENRGVDAVESNQTPDFKIVCDGQRFHTADRRGKAGRPASPNSDRNRETESNNNAGNASQHRDADDFAVVGRGTLRSNASNEQDDDSEYEYVPLSEITGGVLGYIAYLLREYRIFFIVITIIAVCAFIIMLTRNTSTTLFFIAFTLLAFLVAVLVRGAWKERKQAKDEWMKAEALYRASREKAILTEDQSDETVSNDEDNEQRKHRENTKSK